jgi:hypothetical protein
VASACLHHNTQFPHLRKKVHELEHVPPHNTEAAMGHRQETFGWEVVAHPAAHVVVLVHFCVVLTAQGAGRYMCMRQTHVSPKFIPRLRLGPGIPHLEIVTTCFDTAAAKLSMLLPKPEVASLSVPVDLCLPLSLPSVDFLHLEEDAATLLKMLISVHASVALPAKKGPAV